MQDTFSGKASNVIEYFRLTWHYLLSFCQAHIQTDNYRIVSN